MAAFIAAIEIDSVVFDSELGVKLRFFQRRISLIQEAHALARGFPHRMLPGCTVLMRGRKHPVMLLPHQAGPSQVKLDPILDLMELAQVAFMRAERWRGYHPIRICILCTVRALLRQHVKLEVEAVLVEVS